MAAAVILCRMAKSFKELRVWQSAMDLAMEVFEHSKAFPADERFSLTDQFRRCTRSVAANISEAWRKRRYVAAFARKLNDAETEAAEAQTWVELARRCCYLGDPIARVLDARYEELLAQLSTMIRDADRWCTKAV